MKELIKYIVLIALFSPCLLLAQIQNPTEAINGEYHLLEAEQGVRRDQKTKKKLFQYALWGKDKTLLIAACAKCMPGMYKYKEEDSKELGVAVFGNFFGYTVISFDDESFVMIKQATKGSEDWTDFSYSNFYSKNKAKVAAMTHQKIKDYLVSISE